MAKAKPYWNLNPRYTGGSHGAVYDEVFARHVAHGERIAFERALDGAMGEEDRQTARTLGLGGIVEKCVEKGGKWYVEDLLTNRKFIRERKPAKKIKIGEILTAYEDGLTAKRVEGRWRVINALPWSKKGNLMLKLEGKGEEVFVYGHHEVTTEQTVSLEESWLPTPKPRCGCEE